MTNQCLLPLQERRALASLACALWMEDNAVFNRPDRVSVSLYVVRWPGSLPVYWKSEIAPLEEMRLAELNLLHDWIDETLLPRLRQLMQRPWYALAGDPFTALERHGLELQGNAAGMPGRALCLPRALPDGEERG